MKEISRKCKNCKHLCLDTKYIHNRYRPKSQGICGKHRKDELERLSDPSIVGGCFDPKFVNIWENCSYGDSFEAK